MPIDPPATGPDTGGDPDDPGAALPAQAIDTHVHVFDPARFPYPEGPGYRPRPEESGTAADLAGVLSAHGVTHAVIVQPSGYGTDNRALVDAIARFQGQARGIAVVDPEADDPALDRLAAGGVVGVRFDLAAVAPDGGDQSAARAFLERLKARDWVVLVQCPPPDLAAREGLLRDAGVRLVIDHLGSPAGPSPEQPGFDRVLALGREGLATIKLSAPFRVSAEPAPWRDLDPLVAALVAAFTPERAIWASDWPFIKLQARPIYGALLQALGRWLPEGGARAAVAWTTPARLFGFETSPPRAD